MSHFILQSVNAKASELLTSLYKSAPVYIALYKTDPTGADTGTEVTGGAYKRVQINFGDVVLEGNKQTIKNTAEVQFPVATAAWGTITHIGIRTAETGGDLISSVALKQARTIESGDRAVFLVNNAVIRLS